MSDDKPTVRTHPCSRCGNTTACPNPHTLDDCRAAIEADWRAKFTARGGRIELLDSPPPTGLSAAQEIRARSIAEAIALVRAVDRVHGTIDAAAIVETAEVLARYIDRGDGAP